jgi:hypothetical protein
MCYLKSTPLTTALGPTVEVILIVTLPEMFQIR